MRECGPAKSLALAAPQGGRARQETVTADCFSAASGCSVLAAGRPLKAWHSRFRGGKFDVALAFRLCTARGDMAR